MVIGAIAGVGYVLNVAQSAPSLSSLHPLLGGGSSQVYASDGTRLGFIQSDILRTPVGWNEIPTNLKNATVAIEDQRFYKHNGVDLTGIFRAAIKDATTGSAVQGGSTLTMQLVRNLYLGGDQRTLQQKIIEAKLALDYEKHHSKRSILTSYLNSVPYGTLGGQTAVGVQAAARVFFNKPASELNLAQAALLAGLPQAPSEYNPFLDAAAAKARRNEVLAKMAELRYITATEASQAETAPLEVHHGTFYTQRKEDFFFEYVREQLVARYGERTVQQGGLKVYTTINLNMQRLARKAIAEVLNQPEDPASAIVTINPANGDIEAMAESESYEKSQYNLAADGHRQPGSTFKAIDLATAPHGRRRPEHHRLCLAHPPGRLAARVPDLRSQDLRGHLAEQVDQPRRRDARVRQHRLRAARSRPRPGKHHPHGLRTRRQNAPQQLPRGSPRRAHARGHSARNGRRLRHIRRRRASQHTDRDHEGRIPRRPRRQQLGPAPPREGALRRCRCGADKHPASERARRDGRAVGDRLRNGGEDGHHERTDRRMARRLHAELLDGRLDGLPEQARADDHVHGQPQQGGYLPAEIWHAYMAAVTEGQTCQSFPEPKEPASYKPFYGKYASTGQSQAGTEAENEAGGKKPHQKGHRKTATRKPNTNSANNTGRNRRKSSRRLPPPRRSQDGGVGAN